MKKLIILFVAVLGMAFTANAQVSECAKKMREGKFTYEGQENEVEIVRTKTKQTETWNNGKSKLVLEIEWKSDTEYWLTYKRMVNVEKSAVNKGDVIKIKIISCEGNKYFYECRGDNTNYSDGTIIKLE